MLLVARAGIPAEAVGLAKWFGPSRLWRIIHADGPPPDSRLTTLSVTPDPGVIEVNVHPTRSWAEQRELTTTLYDAAVRTGLTTEKSLGGTTHGLAWPAKAGRAV